MQGKRQPGHNVTADYEGASGYKKLAKSENGASSAKPMVNTGPTPGMENTKLLTEDTEMAKKIVDKENMKKHNTKKVISSQVLKCIIKTKHDHVKIPA